MKALVTSDVIGIMLVIISIFVFFTQVMPRMLSLIIDNFSRAAAENVARQLSGLITSSGASTGRIEINYIPTKSVEYKIIIIGRTVKIIPKFKAAYAEKASSTQPFAVALRDYEEENVNHFIVEKDFVGGLSNYVFKARKE